MTSREQSDEAEETDDPGGDQGSGPATFTGDLGGGGATDSTLGRGGTSTPAGDIAGGGQPGSLVDIGEGTATVPDALPTGGAGDLARREPRSAVREELREKPASTRRSALDSAPGIPSGSGGENPERSPDTPDSPLGGAIAADTTPGGPTGDEPDARQVHDEDKGRNTL